MRGMSSLGFRVALVLVLAAGTANGQETKRTTAVRSQIRVLSLARGEAKTVYSAPKHFEAPNWSPDGSYLLLNSEGSLWRLPLEPPGSEPVRIDSGTVSRINNDHGISPDGKTLLISAGQIYAMPATGGAPRPITEKAPSYFHGISPDGQSLVYCAQRDNNFDLYSIALSGGDEHRLTTHAGYDDGPDYSPDGRWIYFNSDRSGSWDIWRIPADGAGPDDARAEQVTRDAMEDWFPHPSPDGKWLVFISYQKGTKGHPANQPVVLRLMPLPGNTLDPEPKVRELLRLFGGQGTINVNSWSPDSSRFAFVSYEPE